MILEDSNIIDMLFRRDESALMEARRKYETYCRSIAHSILDNPEDEEECLNDLWLRVWNSIPPQHPQNLMAYLGKIARNLSLDKYRENHRQKRGGGAFELALEEMDFVISELNTVDGEYEYKELSAIIDSFIRTLPAGEHRIFVHRYWYFRDISQIAKIEQLKPQRVTHILFKIRKALRNYLKKEGFIEYESR
jgi:RNA polymerase sigma factor (sigma-70 family)